MLEEPGQWEVIVFPAIRTKDQCDYDPRNEGEALWPGRHSLEKIQAQKKLSEVSFNSLYQQDPKPNSEILVYKDWIRINQFPTEGYHTVTWGLDFGKTTGINALIKCVTIGMDAYVEEKLYAPGAPVKVIVDVLRASGYNEGEIVWCDHIPSKIQELRNAKIAAIPAIKGPGSVSSGIDKIKEYRMHYIGSNIHLEYTKYQYVTYGNTITNIPVDEYNHALDAIRYGLLSRFFKSR
jgi:phage terminase large subunit